jgi:hypothetical protein
MLHVPFTMASQQENLHYGFQYEATSPQVIENGICEDTDRPNAALQ